MIILINLIIKRLIMTCSSIKQHADFFKLFVFVIIILNKMSNESDSGNIAASSDRAKVASALANIPTPDRFIAGEPNKVAEEPVVTTENFLEKPKPDYAGFEEEKGPELSTGIQKQEYREINMESQIMEEIKEEVDSCRSSNIELDLKEIEKRETRKSIMRFFIGFIIAFTIGVWLFVIFVILGYQFSQCQLFSLVYYLFLDYINSICIVKFKQPKEFNRLMESYEQSDTRMSKMPEEDAEELFQLRKQAMKRKLSQSGRKRNKSHNAPKGLHIDLKHTQSMPKSTTEKIAGLLDKASQIEEKVKKVQGFESEEDTNSAIQHNDLIETNIYTELTEIDKKLQKIKNGSKSSKVALSSTYYCNNAKVIANEKASFVTSHTAKSDTAPITFNENLEGEGQSFFDRTQSWLQKREEKKFELRRREQIKCIEHCTFRPKISHCGETKLASSNFLERTRSWAEKRDLNIKTQRVLLIAAIILYQKSQQDKKNNTKDENCTFTPRVTVPSGRTEFDSTAFYAKNIKWVQDVARSTSHKVAIMFPPERPMKVPAPRKHTEEVNKSCISKAIEYSYCLLIQYRNAHKKELKEFSEAISNLKHLLGNCNTAAQMARCKRTQELPTPKGKSRKHLNNMQSLASMLSDVKKDNIGFFGQFTPHTGIMHKSSNNKKDNNNSLYIA
eukprot:TRINITY_DN169_c0_g1_i1.p3 TRINITY_DN169_c0_g1~~TRINITY_DN169_c0_g1_i1.p3  ORF type:complete len:673 (-),score=61.97 TRINITY_DN169_c0_g1_i1:18685-20703(-)